jgi:hypothetical protein
MSAGGLTEALLESLEACIVETATAAAAAVVAALVLALVAAWILLRQRLWRRQTSVPANGREALAAGAGRVVNGHRRQGILVTTAAWNRGERS